MEVYVFIIKCFLFSLQILNRTGEAFELWFNAPEPPQCALTNVEPIVIWNSDLQS